jgi:hypothetical protein
MKQFALSKNVLEALPISTRRGIEELDSQFLKMKHGLLSNDQFVAQIRSSIEIFFRSLEDAHCKGDSNSQLLAQLAYIENGIQFIKGAMTNRLLGSRYLYEPNLFNPHNMGPYSSLYLFYEAFVDLFERLVMAYNKTRNEPWAFSNLSFLVDISPYSSVRAQVFVPFACAKSSANILIGITINEHAFFQIKATMVLLLHEIGHYVRPFKRIRRNKVLVDVVIRWLENMVYGQLNDYIYAELLSADTHERTEKEKEKIEVVREHFEQGVFPIIGPIISVTLNECFDEFVKSEQVTSVFGDKDQYANLIAQFQEILALFLTRLSNEISVMLLLPLHEARESEEESPKPERVTPGLGVRAKILKCLNEEVEIESESDLGHSIDKAVYFEHLCGVATSLFESSNIFEYKNGIGNSVPDLAVDSYLKSLALMGLTEANKDNIEHFTSVVIRCLKRAVEAMQEESVLEMLIRSLEEALANMFWIRTLNIRDFESYWEIFEPLIQQATFSERDQTQFFGIPNAIITEYFDLYSTGLIQDNRVYNISPVNATTPLTRINNENSEISKEKLVEDLRYIFFIPIARYLLEEDDVFPEIQLFQTEVNKPLSSDGKLIKELREKFRQFLADTGLANNFAGELEMIDFFNRND